MRRYVEISTFTGSYWNTGRTRERGKQYAMACREPSIVLLPTSTVRLHVRSTLGYVAACVPDVSEPGSIPIATTRLDPQPVPENVTGWPTVNCDELTVNRRPGGPDDTGPVERGTVVDVAGGVVDGIVVDVAAVDVGAAATVVDGLAGVVVAIVVVVVVTAALEPDESHPAATTTTATRTALHDARCRIAPPACRIRSVTLARVTVAADSLCVAPRRAARSRP